MTARRIHVCGGGLRALLIADVARRVEQLAGRQCVVTWAFDEQRAADFNIYPADDMTAQHPSSSALFVNCEHTAESFQVAEFSGGGTADPLSLRLALLGLTPEQSAVDTAVAAAALRRWRTSVAEWARAPGAPLSRPHVESAVTAFGELDTARGVEVLRVVEADNQIPPGSKFETFVYLDRVVGVDLARDLGR